ncbi:hypothetical protein PB2503_11769 [Parvularcula bermudensis HTCC2503]|uniref:DUF465 domain-containing protein n=1 Tax=Parvularcula bermudensis (strain ATCC BAA-594 / HTCC2503 / KCTC 12087) TaxID=314260 RepID=E0TDH2_PARBH|nr:YdcH family protein [Parvularcula bermudensis]ADM10398.1 hypothetical protein PB2503_11769 [Parvularcula bermudensis HTCC2503]
MTDDDPKRPRFIAIDGDSANGEPMPPKGANDEAKEMRLTALEQEHRDLDTAIDTLEERMPYDRLTIQRLKKKKLSIKDEIARLRDELWPDIIA